MADLELESCCRRPALNGCHRLHLDEVAPCCADRATFRRQRVLPLPQCPRVDSDLRRELLRTEPAIFPPLDSLLPFGSTRPRPKCHAELVPNRLSSCRDGRDRTDTTIPVVTDVERAAREPEFAVLSLMAHGRDDTETAVSIALAAGHAVQLLSEDQQVLYLALIESALSDAAKKAFEMHPQAGKLMSSWQRGSFEKGRAAEKAADVLDVLDARGLTISSEQRERVLSCTDLDALKTWLRRAAVVTIADELFV